MDQERIESEKTDEVMLPGFRFHPTDEELVGFYLTRKIQQKPLSIELIKQLDIYKYDPWDLPKLATTGEKEWYFYCPRDRKYRNSTRPNRVTGAGFWKATGTDRPIYSSSSQGSKCIGLKKSLVFYKGRAAKGIKTDWMMHEFRLPSLSDSLSPKKYFDKIIPANEAWAICRIFKKASSSTQRALSQSWVSPSLDQTTKSDTINPATITNFNFSTSSNMAMSNKITNTPLHFGFSNDIQQSSIASTFSPLHFPLINHMENTQSSNAVQLNSHYKIPTVESSEPPPKSAINDASSLLLEMSNSMFGEFMKGSENEGFSTCNGFLTENMQENLFHVEETVVVTEQNVGEFDDQWGVIRSFPYGFPMSLSDAWKSNLVWDYSSPCPSELSTSYSTNNCYT